MPQVYCEMHLFAKKLDSCVIVIVGNTFRQNLFGISGKHCKTYHKYRYASYPIANS